MVGIGHQRTREQLLDARTVRSRGSRRFIRGPRYRDLPARLVRELPGALQRYLVSLKEHERPAADRFHIVDAAFRVAGIGSLGRPQIAVLVTGKGGS